MAGQETCTDAGPHQPLCRKRPQQQNTRFIETLLAGLHCAGSKTFFPFFAPTAALPLTRSRVPAVQSPTTSSLQVFYSLREMPVQLQRPLRIWKVTELALPYRAGWP